MIFRITIVAAAILVSGCADPKVANEKNFKLAIQERLDTIYPKCYVEANFPLTTDKIGYNKSTFTALTTAGLLSVKDEPREVKVHLFSNETRTVVEPVFSLTEEGKKFYKPDAEKDAYGKPTGGFCFGKATIKEISEFTEPADAGGMRASQVTYTYQVSDFPAWAKLPEISAAITKLKIDVESEKTPIKDMDILVLTNNGWKSKW